MGNATKLIAIFMFTQLAVSLRDRRKFILDYYVITLSRLHLFDSRCISDTFVTYVLQHYYYLS
jgi:hypothetical protein